MQQEKQGEKHWTNKDGKGIKTKIVLKAVNTKFFLPSEIAGAFNLLSNNFNFQENQSFSKEHVISNSVKVKHGECLLSKACMLLFSTITMHAQETEKEFWKRRNKANKKEGTQKLKENSEK
jgi:hypothetical protein